MKWSWPNLWWRESGKLCVSCCWKTRPAFTEGKQQRNGVRFCLCLNAKWELLCHDTRQQQGMWKKNTLVHFSYRFTSLALCLVVPSCISINSVSLLTNFCFYFFLSHLLGCGWSLPATFYDRVWCWDCTCPCWGGWWQTQGWRLCQDCGTAAPRLGYTYSNAGWEKQDTRKRQTTVMFIFTHFHK